MYYSQLDSSLEPRPAGREGARTIDVDNLKKSM